METYTQRMPDDFHVHLRRNQLMRAVIAHTIAQFGRAIIMPNTKPEAIRDASEAKKYYDEIIAMAQLFLGGENFEPLMTIEITEKTTPTMIRIAHRAGVRAGKIYPRGQTTNSDNGVSEEGYLSEHMFEVYAAMQECGMLLLLHGEIPNYQVLGRNREAAFLVILRMIATRFPKLKIVLEHITSRHSVQAVEELPNVAATITIHHLLIVQDDVLGYSKTSGGFLRSHLNCRPIAKDPEDRLALIAAATSGNPKFFLGSDSAPHTKDNKECADACAGIFSAPVIMPLLVELFENLGKLDALENFTSRFGAEWYGLPLNEGVITLVKEDWDVPNEYYYIVPFMAGEILPWKMQKAT